MTRLPPKRDAIRSLFAKSGNRCTFPGCPRVLIDEGHLLVGRVCHIEAAEPEGKRYNKNQTDEERRGPDNLILLCGEHHDLIDSDPERFTTQVIVKMKHEHELNYGRNLFQLDGSILYNITNEIDSFWNEVVNIQNDNRFDQMLEIKPKSILIGFEEMRDSIRHLQMLFNLLAKSDEGIDNEVNEMILKCNGDIEMYESIPYYDNPFSYRNWGAHNFGLPNWSAVKNPFRPPEAAEGVPAPHGRSGGLTQPEGEGRA